MIETKVLYILIYLKDIGLTQIFFMEIVVEESYSESEYIEKLGIFMRNVSVIQDDVQNC